MEELFALAVAILLGLVTVFGKDRLSSRVRLLIAALASIVLLIATLFEPSARPASLIFIVVAVGVVLREWHQSRHARTIE
jgi:chromate transport protein ChrA